MEQNINCCICSGLFAQDEEMLWEEHIKKAAHLDCLTVCVKRHPYHPISKSMGYLLSEIEPIDESPPGGLG